MKRLLLLLCCALSFSANATPHSKQEIFQVFKESFIAQGSLQNIESTYGIKGEKAQILAQWFEAFSGNEVLLNYFYDQLDQFGITDFKSKTPQQLFEEAKAASEYILLKLYLQGLTKLSSEDLEVFYQHQIRVSKAYSPAACKAFALGDTNSLPFKRESKTIFKKMFRQISVDDLRKLHHHKAKAIFAALDETMVQRTLLPHERSLFQKVLYKIYTSGFSNLPEKERVRISRALMDPTSASDKDACDAAIFVYEQILGAKGVTRDLVMRGSLEIFN